MMIYCSKCGRKLGINDKFCPVCGEKNTNNGGSRPQAAADGKAGKTAGTRPVQQEQQTADPQSIQYVYVNKKTGRITHHPRVKTKSEGCLQFIAIALGAVAVVFLMVAGSVLVTGYLSRNAASAEDPVSYDEPESRPEVSSLPITSETGSYDPVSSEAVSSEPSVPEELTERYLQNRIKGKWKTDVPYKTMSLPGTFEFDGRGRCKCSIKAFLFTKKFDGSYTVKDGGECRLTLDGISEYTNDDTMIGNLRFVTDDEMEFTVEDTVWKLSRVE